LQQAYNDKKKVRTSGGVESDSRKEEIRETGSLVRDSKKKKEFDGEK